MPPPPCITPHCPALTQRGPRCPTCEQQHQRQRGSRQQRGYDATYEQARAALHLEQRQPCHWGCGRPATTADHDPPIAEAGVHYHLVPACGQCNYGHRSARTTRTIRTTD